MFEKLMKPVVVGLGIALCLYTVFQVNYNVLQPESSKAAFVMLGLVLCFLTQPARKAWKDVQWLRWVDALLAVGVVVCCGYVIVQTEPYFQAYWAEGMSLGNRAGLETGTDVAIGAVGLLLVLEGTRRSIGLIVPLLSLAFVGHSYYCYGAANYGWPALPDWLLPHSGQSLQDIVSTTYLQSLGVFGTAADVMFRYVFLFVVFGSFLEMSGATQFIIDFATKTFGRIRGGPAMISVLASGLMGSLSGSAVANAVTTGTFTIPMMRSARFPRHIAGGVMAAAASGGALVPPVMGAGAYMMLEIVDPEGGFLAIMKAALIPAILYYLSILAIVFFYSRRLGATALSADELSRRKLWQYEAIVFFGALGVLIGLLILKQTPFRSVTAALAAILVFATLRPKLALGFWPRVLAVGAFVVVLVAHQYTKPPAPGGAFNLGMEPDRFVQRINNLAGEGLRAAGETAAQAEPAAGVNRADLATRGLERLMSADSNGDGQLSREELRAAADQAPPRRADERPAWLTAFTAPTWYDTSRGVVSPLRVIESLVSSAIFGMFGMLLFGLGHPKWRPEMRLALTKSANNGISLVAASACVGIIIGVVQQTGVAADFSAAIKGVVETNLFLALVGIMACSLVLGMGVPSVVCYMLMATLMGALLSEMGVVPLAAHLFIFYFGMMSMVTPPVALAGYASASIAEAPIMQTSFAAFRFSLVGFTLPYMFVYRPALCLLPPEGGQLTTWAVVHATVAATVGIVSLAAGLAGYLGQRLGWPMRTGLFLAAAMLLAPITQVGAYQVGLGVDLAGCGLFAAIALINLLSPDSPAAAAPPEVGEVRLDPPET